MIYSFWDLFSIASISAISFFPAAAAIDEAVRYFDKTVVYDLYR